MLSPIKDFSHFGIKSAEDLMALCDQLRLGQSDASREEATRLGLRSAAIRWWMVMIGLCEVQCVVSHYGVTSLEPLARLFKRKPVAFSGGSREVLGQPVAVAQLQELPAAMWKEAAAIWPAPAPWQRLSWSLD